MQNNIDRLSGRNSNSNTLTGVQAEVLHQQETAHPVSKPVIDLCKIGEKLEFNDARERTNGKRSEGIILLHDDLNATGWYIFLCCPRNTLE